MKTKLRFLFVLLTMLCWGANFAWGETVTFGFEEGDVDISTMRSDGKNGAPTSVVSNPITFAVYSGSGGIVSIHNERNKLKFQTTTSMTISVASGYSISRVVLNTDVSNRQFTPTPAGTFSVDGTNCTWTGNTSSVTFTNGNEGNNISVYSIEVTYAADSRVELTNYRAIGGYSTNPKYLDEIAASKTIEDNGFLIGDNSGTLIEMDKLSITSSNTSVLTIGAITNNIYDGNRRVYVTYNIVGEGTANIVYSYAGDDHFAPKVGQVAVTTEAASHIATYSNSYPFTWNFNGNSWTSSKIQAKYSEYWNVNAAETEARCNRDYAPANNQIDMISGLYFSNLTADNTGTAGSLCLDWTNKHVWLFGKVTVPNLAVGNIVEFSVRSGGGTITGDSKVGNGTGTVFTVSEAGDAVFTVNGVSILAISVITDNSGAVTYPHCWDLISWSTDLSQNSAYWSTEDPHYYQNAATFSDGASYLTKDGTIFIPEIKGLKFLPGKKDNNYQTDRIRIDKTNGRMQFGAGCQVVIPNTTEGQIIYIDGYKDHGTINVTGATQLSGSWTYSDKENFYVSTGGDVTISNTENYMYLYKLAVNNAITLSSSTPANDATGVSITTLPVLTTNYNISEVTGLTVKDANNNDVSGTITIDNDDITFTPAANFESWTTYTISIPVAGIIQKIAPNYSTNSSAVNVSFTTSGLIFSGSTPANGSKIAGNVDLSQNKIIATFGVDITLNSGKSFSDISISDRTTTTSFVGQSCSVSGRNALLDCPVTLNSGNTYTVTIPKGTFVAADGNTNNLIEFSFTVDNTPPAIVMITPNPISDVPVATRILISSADNTNKALATTTPFTATLTGGSDAAREITAVASSSSYWSFKPSTALTPGTTYTLTIPANSLVTTNGTRITETKTFTFTTVSATTGKAPVLLKTSGNCSPYENEVIADFKTGSTGNTVTLKFDQNITVMDGTKIGIYPYGGSTIAGHETEYNTEGTYYTSEEKNITVSGASLSFPFNVNDMHYDLYYRVVLPANSVVGEGGMPNSADEYIFKVGPAEGYRSSDGYNFQTREGYPYTWDFSVMDATDINAIKGSSSKWKSGNDNSTTYYYRNSFDVCFGKELQGNDNVKLKDFYGLRMAPKRVRNNQNIRLYSPGETDGCLRLHGNTQYFTIPNVPASTDGTNGDHYLYILAQPSTSNSWFGINSPNAEWVSGYEPVAGVKKVHKIRINSEGDISFVCANVNIYKIAYSTYNKTLTSGGEGYATDAHDYHNSVISDKGVDYAMTETLAGQTVTPYYVTNVSGGDDKTPGTVTLTQVSDGVAPGQGTVLIGTAGATFPVFTKAYSKTNSGTSANLLSSVVTSGSVTLNQQDGDNYFYVLNNQPIKVADDENETQIGTGSGIGFYLVHKTTSIPMQAHSAYLIINRKLNQGGGITTSSGAREVYFFKFEDENGNDLTGINSIEADGIKNNSTNGDGLYYDLRGQRHIYPTKPGLYIHNGKKVYLK